MKKIMKKIILLLAVCSMSIASFAATGGAVNATINWTLDDEGVLTISGTGDMPNYASSTDAPWDTYENDIVEIIVQEGITYIGKYAFVCNKVLTLIIPESVTSANMSFASLPSLKNLYYNAINCNSSFESFGASCGNLENLVIGNNVTRIPDYFVLNAWKITSVNLPNSVTYIGHRSFENCPITSIIIPENVSTIQSRAFGQIFITINTLIFNAKKCALAEYVGWTTITHLIIGENVQSLPANIFAQCVNLKKIQVPWNESNLDAVSVETSAFTGLDKSQCKLIVPAGTKNLYKQANAWKNFNIIEKINIETISDLFSWQKVEDATGYQLIIYSDIEKTNILYILNFTEDGKYIPSQQPAKPQFAVAETETYSHQITGLENNTDYFYALTAFENEKTIAEQEGSFKTDVITALPAVKKSDINLYVSGKNIIIENAQSKNIQIFNIFGQTLANVKNSSETAQIPMHKAGIYLVKIGLETQKVVIE